jgi:hypothetical protein
MSKKIIALFSILAMFSFAAIAQDAPKKTGAKRSGKRMVVPANKVVKTKAVKAKAEPVNNKINK